MKVIQKFINNPLRNFNYIVMSEKSCECIFFDPCDLSQTLELINGQGRPAYLLNTHAHYDHIKDNDKFLAINGTKKLELKDGESFYLSKTEQIRAVSTPGHIDPHYCFELIENEETIGIITGDLLFNAGVGNCKDSSGNSTILFETIKNKILPLKGEIKIYPSHDYFLKNLEFARSVDPENDEVEKYLKLRASQNLDEEFILTSIETEKKINPFLRVFDQDFKSNFPHMSEQELFIHLRSLRDNW